MEITNSGHIARLIAFYLPQYHPIPENDEWWGKGFTDWSNVVRSRPRFSGHYQPHIPADLGFCDLRLEETRIAQAKLAAQYGISGFCYYHYWFNGRMLLDRPFNAVLESGKPDFPFCLCWANENWTRRWDGQDQEVLIRQDYKEYDCDQHIDWLDRAFSDPRYIRINGKPLFLIYHSDAIPGIEQKISYWRQLMKNKGYPGIYLCAVKSYQHKLSDYQTIALGFDSVVDFQPSSKDLPKPDIFYFLKAAFNRNLNKIIDRYQLGNIIPKQLVTYVYDYRTLVRNAVKKSGSNIITFPCVVPSWDNSARKKFNTTVIHNNDAELYGKWLEEALRKVEQYESDEKIVFINAWNEWAEGCHLEPDLKNGKMFLEATKNALKNIK